MSDKPITTYILDDETLSLVEVALNCMVQLSEAQVDETSAENLIAIADALAERFNITPTVLEEEHHGDEIIYKPKGGIFRDEDEEES